NVSGRTASSFCPATGRRSRRAVCVLRGTSELPMANRGTTSRVAVGLSRGLRFLLAGALSCGTRFATATRCDAVPGPLLTSSFLSFEVGHSPRAVAVGDLNGDGIPDLVA